MLLVKIADLGRLRLTAHNEAHKPVFLLLFLIMSTL